MAGPWPHRARVRVRYHECDMQRVVFNAHYLTYCDEAMGSWLSEAFGWQGDDDDHFDWMLVKIVLEWHGSATFGDTLDIDLGVLRWGTTSFDTGFRGTVDDRPVFEATITYVCVRPGTAEKMPVPHEVRDRLGLVARAG